MTPGTYTGSYGSIVNPSVVSFTITATGIVSGYHSPAAVYASTAHTLTNFGKVTDTAVAGVELKAGGAVINGSASDTSAYINGYTNGVSILGSTGGTVTNSGTIQSTFRGNGPFGYTNADYYHTGKIGFDGIYLHSGGAITNSGAASDIYGWAGVETFGGSLSITNAGTIAGYSTGIYLLKGSTGLTVNNSGLIHSRVNEAIMAYSGSVSITNTGTVLASGAVTVYESFGYAGNRYPGAIYVGGGVLAGATITNGSATNNKALIRGYAYGISVYTKNAVTITNWATIAGVGTQYIGPGGGIVASPQTAISFYYNASAADRVIDEAGATFVGLVEGGGAASVLELASPSSTGTISGIGTQFLGFGTIAVDTGATWNMTGANTIATETVRTNSTHPTLVNAGTIKVAGTLTLATGGALTNTGVIDVGGGEFLANIGVGNAGSFQVGTGGRIDFASSASTGTQIDFLDATGKLILGTPSGVTLGVTGFVHGDEIDLPGVSYDTGHMTATYASGQLSVYDNGVLKADIHVTGLSAGSFTPANDGGGGTEITPACYCRGTLVLTDRGEVAVEDLMIGDRLVTRDGAAKPLKWIGRRSYVGWLVAGNPRVLPVCFKPGSLADGVPRRELWVSPEHAIYLDGVLVPAELLVNGSSILKAASVDEVEYFHLELEAHDVILAEGAWAESFVDDDSRGMFHNAAEYRALYPEAPLHAPALYCAPRVEDGFELEALCRRLLGRARRLRADGTAAAAAALEGHLDLVRHGRIAGWARDPKTPTVPVALVVLANGAEIGRVMADRYRRDLEAAGIGDGVHAFELIVPGGLAAAWEHTIEVCHEADGTMLPGSPVVLQPAADGISGEVLGNFAA